MADAQVGSVLSIRMLLKGLVEDLSVQQTDPNLINRWVSILKFRRELKFLLEQDLPGLCLGCVKKKSYPLLGLLKDPCTYCDEQVPGLLEWSA